MVIDPFAGSCNTLFWILRQLPNSEGIAFESDLQVFELTQRNLAALDQKIELVHGDYVRLLEERRVPEDRGIVAFVAPPWGTALDEVQGLDLRRTIPPISDVIEQLARQFPEARHPLRHAGLRERSAARHRVRFGSDLIGPNCVSTTSMQKARITDFFWERKAGHRVNRAAYSSRPRTGVLFVFRKRRTGVGSWPTKEWLRLRVERSWDPAEKWAK